MSQPQTLNERALVELNTTQFELAKLTARQLELQKKLTIYQRVFGDPEVTQTLTAAGLNQFSNCSTGERQRKTL